MTDHQVIINSQIYKLIPLGFCKCGCGGITTIFWGKPRKFITGHNRNRANYRRLEFANKGFCECGCGAKTKTTSSGIPRRFINHHHKKRSLFLSKHGKLKSYPCIGHNGKNVREHVVLAEKALGKPLPKGSRVHHHTSEQLVICNDDAYHKLLHKRMKAIAACGHANWRKCWICKKYDDPNNLYTAKRGHPTYHNGCYNEKYNKRK